MKDFTVTVTGSIQGTYKVAADTEDNAHEAASNLLMAEVLYGEWDGELNVVCTEDADEDAEICDRTYDAARVLKVAEKDLQHVYSEIVLEDK